MLTFVFLPLFGPVRIVVFCVQELTDPPLGTCKKGLAFIWRSSTYNAMEVMMNAENDREIAIGQTDALIDTQTRSFVLVESNSLFPVI